MTVTPADVTNALQARHERTEGRPLTDDELHESLVEMAGWVVAKGTEIGEAEADIVASVKNLAVAAAKIPGYDTQWCDQCGGTYDEAVLEAADAVVAPSATQNDSNGDPDVTVCGFCIYERDDTGYEPSAHELAAEAAERDRQVREDHEAIKAEASYPGGHA